MAGLVVRAAVTVVVAAVLGSGLPSSGPPAAAGVDAPGYCADDVLDAATIPASISLEDCDVVGRTVVAGGLEVRVPPPGEGTEVSGLALDGEYHLAVRTTPDGVVEIDADEPAATVAASPPANDAIANARPLSAASAVAGTTDGATHGSEDNAAAQACASQTGTSKSVWYSITPSQSRDVELSFTDISSQTGLLNLYRQVFRRGPGGSLTRVACASDTFAATGGTTYVVRVFTYGFTSADFKISWRALTRADRPANDLFANATRVGVPSTAVSHRLRHASLQSGEPKPSCGPAAMGTVWYRLRPGTLRRVTVQSDATVALYQGSALSALRRRACVPPTSRPTLLRLPRSGPHYLQVWSDNPNREATVRLGSGEPCPGCPPPCDVRDYAEVNVLPRKPLRWHFNASSAPADLGAAAALRAVKAGIKVITSSKNDCGMADRVDARAIYRGTTRARAGLCTGGERADRRNTVDFGPVPTPGTVAITCSRQVHRRAGWRIVETDMRLSRTAPWTVRPDRRGCRREVDLVGVVAHETGHVFGLKHPRGQRAGNQTMAAAMPLCSGALRTLGRGDVLGLRARY